MSSLLSGTRTRWSLAPRGRFGILDTGSGGGLEIDWEQWGSRWHIGILYTNKTARFRLCQGTGPRGSQAPGSAQSGRDRRHLPPLGPTQPPNQCPNFHSDRPPNRAEQAARGSIAVMAHFSIVNDRLTTYAAVAAQSAGEVNSSGHAVPRVTQPRTPHGQPQ